MFKHMRKVGLVAAALAAMALGGAALAQAEPWVVGAAVAGTLLAGATGLLVWGQSKTELRGSHYDIGAVHFWLGIGLAVVLVLAAGLRIRSLRQGKPTHNAALLAAGTIALVAVFVQGFLGGRMTYDRGVGVADAGEFAQSAHGAERLEVALARGTKPAVAGQMAFSASGLGCAKCHGDRAQGMRGPALAGGRDVTDFRRVHAHGLFPPAIVSDKDFRAIDAYLRTIPGRAGEEGG